MRSFSFSLLSLACLALIQLLCSPLPQVQGKAVLPALPSHTNPNDGSASLPTVAPSQAFVEKRRRKEARKEMKRHAAMVGRAVPVPAAAAPVAGRRRAQPLGRRDSNPDIIKARDGLVPLQHLPRQQQQQQQQQQERGEQKKKRACTTSERKKRALKREKRAAKAKRAEAKAAAAQISEERSYAPDPADHPLN